MNQPNTTLAPTLRARNAARLLAQAEAAASAKPFDSVPQIDLTPLVAPDPQNTERTAAIAKEIRDACLEVGFFYVTGHGVDADLIARTFEATKDFFDLPLEQKAGVSILNSAKMRGYTGLLEENTDPDNDGDLHEAFDIGLDLADDDPDAHTDVYGWGLNQWPDVDGFRELIVEYHTAMLTLARALYRGFALSLDLDGDYFTPKLTKPISELRLLRYPTQPAANEKVLGIGQHSDYDMFTILATDEVPALEILNPAGEWIPAPPVEGAFIVNVGDLLERATNDLYRSTVHRVINRSGRERYSLPSLPTLTRTRLSTFFRAASPTNDPLVMSPWAPATTSKPVCAMPIRRRSESTDSAMLIFNPV